MRIRTLLVVFVVLLLSGCATTRKGQDIQIQQLQSRISYLEEELERKNQEISDLESGLERAQDISLSSRKQKIDTTLQLSTKQIQIALKNAGFYNGAIDGKIGSKTKEAIKDFQRANGLKADGIVGKRTQEKLNKYLER